MTFIDALRRMKTRIDLKRFLPERGGIPISELFVPEPPDKDKGKSFSQDVESGHVKANEAQRAAKYAMLRQTVCLDATKEADRTRPKGMSQWDFDHGYRDEVRHRMACALQAELDQAKDNDELEAKLVNLNWPGWQIAIYLEKHGKGVVWEPEDLAN